MLSSGISSYYDDYARKRGSSRLIHDPPSLLTDRGAYVNFLEVQLERVSAACLGVQAHNERFNDMHEVISILEDKVASAMRLVGLAQQCTEEVRLEADGKINMMKKITIQEHNEMISSLQTITDRISNLEKSMNTTFHSMLPRIDKLEQRVIEQNQEQLNDKIRHEQEINDLKLKLSTIETSYSHSVKTIESLVQHIDRLENNVQESERNTQKILELLEKRFQESICQTQDDIYRKLEENYRKHVIQSSQLENDLITKETSIKQKIQEQYDEFYGKVSNVESQLYDCDKKTNQSLQDLNESLSEKIHNKHVILENMFTIQEGLKVENETLENESRRQFMTIEAEIESIHDLISKNNSIIVDKIVEKEENDNQHFQLYTEEISMLKETLDSIKDDVTAMDIPNQVQLEPIIRSQVRDILVNEMSVAKSLSGLMDLSKSIRSKSSRSSGPSKSRLSSYHKSRKLPGNQHNKRSRNHKGKKEYESNSRSEFSLSDDDGNDDEIDTYDSNDGSSDDGSDSDYDQAEYNKQGRMRITKDLCSSERGIIADIISPIRPSITKSDQKRNKKGFTQNDIKRNNQNQEKDRNIIDVTNDLKNEEYEGKKIKSDVKLSSEIDSKLKSSSKLKSKPKQNQGSEVDLKEVLANFLDVYLVDQQAIRERLNELRSESRSGRATLENTISSTLRGSSSADEANRKLRRSISLIDGNPVVELLPHDTKKSSSTIESQYYSDSELVPRSSSPNREQTILVTSTNHPQTSTSTKDDTALPSRHYLTATASSLRRSRDINPNVNLNVRESSSVHPRKLSKEHSKSSDTITRRSYQSQSSGDESGIPRLQRPPHSRLNQSSDRFSTENDRIVSTNTSGTINRSTKTGFKDSKLRVSTKSSSGDYYYDDDDGDGSGSGNYSNNNSSDHYISPKNEPCKSESFEFDEIYEHDDNIKEERKSPRSGRILSQFFSRIPQSSRSLSAPNTPNRTSIPANISNTPNPSLHHQSVHHQHVHQQHEYSVEEDVTNSPQRSSSRSKYAKLNSPFTNPLSRRPKTSRNNSDSSNSKNIKSPGSDTSTISTSTTSTTITPSAMMPAGMIYPSGSLGTHLQGAAVKVKPNAPTRIL